MTTANIRIVLVQPAHPGNVGAVARAMKNFCLESLYLVAPRNFPSSEASNRAAGAVDVLDGARTCASLDEALADCHVVIGSSARTRRIQWPELDPNACGELLAASARHGPVALLFGRERTGLTNEELDRCHFVVHIPTNQNYPSLNLAGAVHILAFEVARSYSSGSPDAADAARRLRRTPVTQDEMRRFHRHLEQVLTQIRFLDPEHPRLLRRRLIRLFHRAAPDRNEMNILRGILTAVQTSLEKADTSVQE